MFGIHACNNNGDRSLTKGDCAVLFQGSSGGFSAMMHWSLTTFGGEGQGKRSRNSTAFKSPGPIVSLIVGPLGPIQIVLKFEPPRSGNRRRAASQTRVTRRTGSRFAHGLPEAANPHS